MREEQFVYIFKMIKKEEEKRQKSELSLEKNYLN